MSEMEKISETVIAKVQKEADQIIKEAEKKALQEIEKAEELAELKSEQEKRKIIEEAEREAAKILAQALIQARQELAKVKSEIINKIRNKAQTQLAKVSTEPSLLIKLVREGIDGLGADKVRIYVSSKDMAKIQQALNTDKELAGKVIEVKEVNCVGGVIVESIDGKISVDNTYDTRLEMLLPRIIPEIGKELFKAA